MMLLMIIFGWLWCLPRLWYYEFLIHIIIAGKFRVVNRLRLVLVNVYYMRKTLFLVEFMFAVYLATLVGCGGSVCGRAAKKSSQRPVVAATNSYLEAAIADLTGDMPDAVEVTPLAGAGMCPGHFDLRPSQIERLAECRLLVRFDFQERLAEKLAGRVGDSLRIVSIEITGGLCQPSSYTQACRQIADALVEAGCIDRAAADKRLAEIDARMKNLSTWSQEQIATAGLDGLAVVASGHQESFCRWLGLDVAATYNGSETRPSRIDAAVADAQNADARLLIANLPEGRRVADMLAERLGIEVVVFENFPRPDGLLAFDQLVRDNVDILISAVH